MKVDAIPSEVSEAHYRRPPPTAERMFADSTERLRRFISVMANNQATMDEIHHIEDLEDKQVASALFTQMCADEDRAEAIAASRGRDDDPTEAARHAPKTLVPPDLPCTREQVDNALYAVAAIIGPIAAEPILELRVSPKVLESKLAYVKGRCLDGGPDRVRSPENFLMKLLRNA